MYGSSGYGSPPGAECTAPSIEGVSPNTAQPGCRLTKKQKTGDSCHDMSRVRHQFVGDGDGEGNGCKIVTLSGVAKLEAVKQEPSWFHDVSIELNKRCNEDGEHVQEPFGLPVLPASPVTSNDSTTAQFSSIATDTGMIPTDVFGLSTLPVLFQQNRPNDLFELDEQYHNGDMLVSTDCDEAFFERLNQFECRVEDFDFHYLS